MLLSPGTVISASIRGARFTRYSMSLRFSSVREIEAVVGRDFFARDVQHRILSKVVQSGTEAIMGKGATESRIKGLTNESGV